MNNNNCDKTIQFLYSSINDIQGIIKSIDSKIGLLFLIQLFPLASLGNIHRQLQNLYSYVMNSLNIVLFILLIVIFIGVWILSILASLKAIIAVDTPASHIKNIGKTTGAFYRPGLYELNFSDVYINRKRVNSKYDIEELIKELPYSEIELVQELTFEQMKLAYIRDIKLIRQKWSFILTIIWMIIGFISYIIPILK